MAAHYTNITQAEMEDFLVKQNGFYPKPMTLPRTVELVYGKQLKHKNFRLTLRVYTGINPSGQSRQVGEDAIRVTLFMWVAEGKVVKLAGDRRVHRVAGWRANLQNRIDRWLENFPDQICPACGKPMVPRAVGKSKTPTFLGCVGFPECRKTLPLPKENS